MPSLIITVMLVAGTAPGGELPRPIFYLPLDGSTTAAIAGGRSTRETTSLESILTLVETQRPKFYPGLAGRCYDVGDSPLVFSSKGNFSPREGTISFWLHPQFRGDDKKLYCIFFSAGPWGMLYKYSDQSSLTFATARPTGDWYYNCGVGGIGGWRPGQAHHVAMCWSRQGNFRRLYVDGKLGRQAPFPFHREIGDEPLVIGGGSQHYAMNVADRRIEQVGIWDRPLDDRAVARLFALGMEGKPLGKVSATSASDRTGVGRLEAGRARAWRSGRGESTGMATADPDPAAPRAGWRMAILAFGTRQLRTCPRAAGARPRFPGFGRTARTSAATTAGPLAATGLCGRWPTTRWRVTCATFTIEPKWQHQPISSRWTAWTAWPRSFSTGNWSAALRPGSRKPTDISTCSAMAGPIRW